MFKTKVVEKFETQFMFNNFFLIVPCMRLFKKIL